MTLVPTAAGAVVLGARPDQLKVALGVYMTLNMVVERWPAGTTFVLGLGGKERQVAAGADIFAAPVFIVELAGPSGFGALFKRQKNEKGWGRPIATPQKNAT